MIRYNELMNEKFLTEKIGYYRNLLTLFWTSSFLLGSGISWSFVNIPKMDFVLPSGLLGIAFFLVAVLFIHVKIRKLIKELKQ